MELEKQTKGIYSCLRCGVCVFKYDPSGIKKVCPVREHTAGFEPYSSRGRIQIARAILEGDLEYTPEMAKVIYQCLLCANCREACGQLDLTTLQPRIDVPAITKAMRADLFEAGVEVPEAVIKFGEAIEKTFWWGT